MSKVNNKDTRTTPLLHIFRTPFHKNTTGGLLLKFHQKVWINEHLRIRLRNLFQIHFKFRYKKNSIATQGMQTMQKPAVANEVRSQMFQPQNMKKKNEKQRKAEELDRNNNSKSPQTGKVWIDFSHLSCKMVVVNWSTGDAELIPFIWKKINLRIFVSDIYDRSPFTLSSLSIGLPLL